MDHLKLQNAVVEDNAVDNVGRRIILPSTFLGGPNCMQQNYQDAMAIVRKYGKSDLFIIFTCNTGWLDIVDNLSYEIRPSDRPDIVARVFNLKLIKLMDDIAKKYIFGKIDAYV